MAAVLERARLLLPGLWAGFLVCIAAVATPAAFALLPTAEAGRVAARILAHEAHASLAMGVVLLVLERVQAKQQAGNGTGSQFSAGMVLALLTVFCTVAGYFVLQPMMPAARAGQGPLSFGQLHAASAVFFGIKGLAVLAMAWRATRPVFSRTASS